MGSGRGRYKEGSIVLLEDVPVREISFALPGVLGVCACVSMCVHACMCMHKHVILLFRPYPGSITTESLGVAPRCLYRLRNASGFQHWLHIGIMFRDPCLQRSGAASSTNKSGKAVKAETGRPNEVGHFINLGYQPGPMHTRCPLMAQSPGLGNRSPGS